MVFVESAAKSHGADVKERLAGDPRVHFAGRSTEQMGRVAGEMRLI